MSDSTAAVFNTDDSDLDLLLDQAKVTLARKEEEAQREKKARAAAQSRGAKAGSKPAALSVPLRLDVGEGIADSLFIKMNSRTGVAKLDLDKVYRSEQGGSSSAKPAAEIEATRKDPTIKGKTAKEIADERASTAGSKWFGMKAPVLTQEVKNDLRVLQLRNVLDPKRFYKKNASSGKIPKYFETGTIIEGATEFYSGRLTKKERRNNLVDELLADKQARDYFKRKVSEIQTHNASGGKSWYKGSTNYKPKSNFKRQRK
ncbi:Fcf2-domain-containing protein [Martensiomyces pterosporus]|nr:Fcf2-domain-containing protein [Martensiomyces pterosporus]